jgi:hypothetical protein
MAVLGLVVVMGGLVGCSGFRVEHQGNEVGEGICDLRTATSKDDITKAANKINENLNDAARIAGRPINEDLGDVQNNVADLFNHVSDGQQALTQQDIAVIQRNVQQVIKNTTGYRQRFWQGVAQGLGDCAG